MLESTNFMKILKITTVLMLCCCSVATSILEAKEKIPEKGIQVILSIYSGRRNPQWFLSEGPGYDKLVSLLKNLNVQDKKLFEYSKWNTLGYTKFWIIAKNIEGIPYITHIWMNEASVVFQKGEKAKQAVGAMPIYEMLASHALKTKKAPNKFFQRYLKFKAEKEKKEKEEKEKQEK